MKNTSAIERIQKMERNFDKALKAVADMEEALENFRSTMPETEELIAYYESNLWRRDYKADSKGRFPKELKRGVLSQDGVYNLITDYQRLKDLLNK